MTWGPTAQAISGLTYLSGLPDQPPADWGHSYLDHSAGYYGAIAVLLALRRGAREGGAQRIDLSQGETGMVMTGVQMLDAQVNGRPSERIGNGLRYPAARAAQHVPLRRRRPLDRLAAESDAHWRALCEVLGAGDLAADERFATDGGRVAALAEIDAALEALTRSWDARELMYALQARGVPAGAAQTPRTRWSAPPSSRPASATRGRRTASSVSIASRRCRSASHGSLGAAPRRAAAERAHRRGAARPRLHAGGDRRAARGAGRMSADGPDTADLDIWDQVFFAFGSATAELGLRELDRAVLLAISSGASVGAKRAYELHRGYFEQFGNLTFDKARAFSGIFAMAMVSRWVRHLCVQDARLDGGKCGAPHQRRADEFLRFHG